MDNGKPALNRRVKEIIDRLHEDSEQLIKKNWSEHRPQLVK